MIAEGSVFTELTVIQYSGRSKEKKPRHQWLCRCSCGELKNIRGHDLVHQQAKSCGCLRRKGKHRHTAGRKHSAEYTTWGGMIKRCTNPKAKSYERYGGRGISVCQRWRDSFVDFYEDVGPKPSNEHSLERIDNNKNYEPENCRWATGSEQARNTRRNHTLTLSGVTRTLVEWSEITGLKSSTIRMRVSRYGWSVERALTEGVA
jgi:hypothetical protein